MSFQYGDVQPTRLTSVRLFGEPQQISTGFASWLRYCSHVAQRKSTLHDVWPYVWLVGLYTIYIFEGSCPLTEFRHVHKIIHFPSKSCVILAALLHGTLAAKLCGVVQGMELRNIRRRRHLYSAGRPSRWASAYILVRIYQFCFSW